MCTVDSIGYLASALVFTAFHMKSMMTLRIVAIFSNVAFIIYAICLNLEPVLILHAALVPLNVWRLWQSLRVPRTCVANQPSEP